MKNTIKIGKRRRLLSILSGMFLITTFIISCSGKKTGQNAEEKTEPRQENEEIASKPNSEETDNTAPDGGFTQDDNFIPKDLWVARGNSVDPEIIFDFQGNNVTKSRYLNGISDRGEFIIQYVNNVPFLIIDWKEGASKGTSNRYLMLANENNFMLLYDKNNNRPLYELFYYEREFLGDPVWYGMSLCNVNSISATSTLTENKITYSPGNMNDQQINSVWAEGVPGYGINEIITFYGAQAEKFYISIGYVSYSRPELYTENSRPKRIRVTVDGKSIEIMLKDTPAYQTIDVNAFNSEVTIQILEVYTGTKYEDTCINSIINHFSQ